MAINENGIKVSKVRSKDPTVQVVLSVDAYVGFGNSPIVGTLHLMNKDGQLITATAKAAPGNSGNDHQEHVLTFEFADEDWGDEVSSSYKMHGNFTYTALRKATTADIFSDFYQISLTPENSFDDDTVYQFDRVASFNHVQEA